MDFQRVILYWNIGQRIFEEEQSGKKRAEYGKGLIKNLSFELEPVFGSAYSYRQLYLFLQFYKAFPIVNTVRSQLNWTQYKLLTRIDDDDKRDFYVNEHIKNIFSSEELLPKATIRKFLIVQLEGSREVSRKVEHYNLEAIIALGYRINSQRATDFRKWATRVLKNFALRGYVLDNERLGR